MADKITDMNAYKQSAAYQSLGIDKLQEQLAGYQTDDAALRKQAEAEYKPTYDANLEALKHQTAQQIQGYQGQLAGLGTAYDKQREKTNESYNQSILSASNALTRRGLGRSSLVATQGAYLEKQRNAALADINADQTAAANAINEKIALLTDQAAQSEKTMAGNYASQIEARMNELKEKNQSAATSLQLQISALQQQGYQAYQEQLLKQQQMEREQANLDREYEAQQKQYADALAQQQWQNAFNEQQAAASKEQWQKEFEAQQLAQQMAQANADRNFAAQQEAAKQAQANAEREYAMQELAQKLAQQNADRDYAFKEQTQKQNQANADREYALQQMIQELNKLTADRNWELAQREQQLAEDQFAYTKEQNAKKSSGGGSSGSSYRGSTNSAPTPAPETPPSSDDMIGKLMGDLSGKAATSIAGTVQKIGSTTSDALTSIFKTLTGSKNKAGTETKTGVSSAASKFKSTIAKQ